jgi:probable phosphoglycerate mutase
MVAPSSAGTPPPAVLHLLRHGQTAASRENRFCGSGLDLDLTDEGCEMAQALVAACRRERWTAIYASPMRRTLQTAEPIAGALGLPVHELPDLREIAYGAWEGLSVDEVSRRFHDDHLRWLADPAWNPPTGGETAMAVAERALRAAVEIRGRSPNGNVLVVSHKATIRVLLCALLGVDVGRFRYRFACPVGSFSVVEFRPEGPFLRTLADRGHLGERLRGLAGT